MTSKCVFRVEVKGRLWRLVIEEGPEFSGLYGYRVMNRRRVLAKGITAEIESAVKYTLEMALECPVSIKWRAKL